MKDLDSGGTPPDAEASAGIRAKKRRGNRNAGRLRAGEAGGARTADAGKQGADPKNTRKRKKRRRGRKVFARDAVAERSVASVNGAPADAAATPAVAVTPATAETRMPMRPRARAVYDAGAPAYAALDLGTNNCRLLVAVPGRPGQFRVVDSFSRIVRLGEGLSATGRLGDQAMDRALDALATCADRLGQRSIRKARLIATEACRAAENGAAFLARVTAETGLELEVIDRETEARLAVSGCGSLVERDTDGVVLFDIGGGSSEIALIDISERRSNRLADHIVSWTSLPVGVVSLSERFGGRDVTPAIFAAMVEDVAAMIERFDGRGRLAHVARGERFHLLGTSGTVTTLAGIFLDLPRYDRRRVDGLWMNDAQIDGMVARLLDWEFHERVANPCIGPDRADLVLAGCAILEAIRRVWPSGRLRVADRGLREGILTELMAEDGVWRRNREGAS